MRDTKDWDMIQGGARARGPRRGFTLVELIYIVILLGILAGFAAPLIDVSRFRLNSAVMEVTTQLMSAQRYAVLRGHDVVIAFDEDENWMRIHLDANNDGLIQADENTSVAQLGDGVTFGRAPGATLSASTETVTFTQKQVGVKSLTFHRNGSASEMGYIYLTFARSSLPQSNRAIEIVRSTAKVKCWSYRTDTWQETC
jgi:Tfp pilus assembly protein FimT